MGIALLLGESKEPYLRTLSSNRGGGLRAGRLRNRRIGIQTRGPGHSLCTAPMQSRSGSLAPIHSIILSRYKKCPHAMPPVETLKQTLTKRSLLFMYNLAGYGSVGGVGDGEPMELRHSEVGWSNRGTFADTAMSFCFFILIGGE